MAKAPRGIPRRLLSAAGGLVLLLVVAVLVVSLIRIPIPLARFKGPFEAGLSRALGREVRVEGDIIVTTSLWPRFEIEGLRIANPGGFDAGEFARMKVARLGVSVVDLLVRGRIHVDTFRVKGLSVDLVRGVDGSVNWQIGGDVDAPPAEELPAEDPDGGGFELASDALAVEEIAFDDIAVRYTDEAAGETHEFVLEECAGSAAYGDRMQLAMKGSLRGEPFTLRLEASSLSDFLALADTELAIELEIADTKLRFEGSSAAFGQRKSVEFQVVIEGDRLDSLDGLLAVGLPPLRDYRVAGQLRATRDRLDFSDLEVRVGESVLKGSMSVDRTGARPTASLALLARRVQLDDFALAGWSPEGDALGQEDKEMEVQTEAGPSDIGSEELALMSPEVLGRADLKLTLEVDEVLASDDALGSGHLELTLTNGRITLAPFRLDTPGGSVLLEASLKPGTVASEASLRVLIEDFDFGLLVRRLNPETDLGGTLNMDIDVRSSAGAIGELLQHANGYIDVSGRPINLAAGVIDLWAVNLLASVVSSAVKGKGGGSQINCLISRWSMHDGLLRADNLAIDTSKIRICGRGEIDFRKQDFDLVVAPTAKRPEFFSLATPLAVKGHFEDFQIGMAGGKIAAGTTTAVRFVISPVTVPIKRFIQTDLPQDGTDICSLPIGPHTGEMEPLPGCTSGLVSRLFEALGKEL